MCSVNKKITLTRFDKDGNESEQIEVESFDFNHAPDWDNMVFACNELAKQTEITLNEIIVWTRRIADLLHDGESKPIKPQQPYYQKFNKQPWKR
jgi:hypothetical protein